MATKPEPILPPKRLQGLLRPPHHPNMGRLVP